MKIRLRSPFIVTRRGSVDTFSLYESRVKDIIQREVNKIIRDKSAYIFCGACDQNILLEKEPTVFGAKGKGAKSSTYHMQCWRELDGGSI